VAGDFAFLAESLMEAARALAETARERIERPTGRSLV
jgi:hypothetical protein